MAQTAIDFLLEDLELILDCRFLKRKKDLHLILDDYVKISTKDPQTILDCNFLQDKNDQVKSLYEHLKFSTDQKGQLLSLYEDLKFIRNFLKDTEERWDMHKELRLLVEEIGYLASDALQRFDSFVLCETTASPPSDLYFGGFIERIEFIRNQLTEIYDKRLHATCVLQDGLKVSQEASSSRAIICKPRDGLKVTAEASSSPATASNPRAEKEEIVVGFDTEAMAIVEQLIGQNTEPQKQLDVISIVGMAGIGKTTLAKKVYSDPYVMRHFDIRGWTYVSQLYQKGDLLLSILSSIDTSKTKIHERNDLKLEEQLYRSLKGRRYLIVIDDVWDIGAWENLKNSFPRDNSGSRILLTTRLTGVALRIKPDTPPHHLPCLGEDESWNLLQQKSCHKETCPSELMKIGKQIAAKCRGLPLAIVVVGGILATKEKTCEQWQQAAESLSSYIVGEAEQFMDILEWSYNDLPCYLKRCFVYFGEFPEDYEIPVWKLIYSWIAQGFVLKKGQKRLEDVAEEYLMDLIDRNLVLVAKSRFGQIKACRIHDMLHDLCLIKRKGDLCFIGGTRENFLWPHQKNAFSKEVKYDWQLIERKDGLCFHSHGFHSFTEKRCAALVRVRYKRRYDLREKSFLYKLLRVLDLSYIMLDGIPEEISVLVHLKYLELGIAYEYDRYKDYSKVRRILENLLNLETLIIQCSYVISLPYDLYNMVKLRHLIISGGLKFDDVLSDSGSTSTSALDNLQIISQLRVCDSTNSFLARTPNVRKLKLYQPTWREEPSPFVDVANLVYLETLKFYGWRQKNKLSNISQLIRFPPNLKELSLYGCNFDWKEMSTLGKLPNLEILILKGNFFKGPEWSTTDDGFPKLRVLKLVDMDLERWITSSDHFPSLQHLVLKSCKELEEIPSALGDIPTLLMIELEFCSRSAMRSAEQIKKEQYDIGNYELKILLDPMDEIFRSAVTSPKQIEKEQYDIGNYELKIILGPLAKFMYEFDLEERADKLEEESTSESRI